MRDELLNNITARKEGTMVESAFFCIIIFLILFTKEVVKRMILKSKEIKSSIEYTEKHGNQDPVFKRAYDIVEDLAKRARISTPALKIIKDPKRFINAGSAFMRRNFSAIMFGEGVIEQLTSDELEGFIAHEIGHICTNRYFFGSEFMIMISRASIYSCVYISLIASVITVLSLIVGVVEMPIIGITVLFILLFVLTHRIAKSFYRSMSHDDEFIADAYASNLLGGPDKVILATRKIFEIQISTLESCSVLEEYEYLMTSSDTSPSIRDLLVALHKLKKE